MERETRLELATSTLARLHLRSPNVLFELGFVPFDRSLTNAQNVQYEQDAQLDGPVARLVFRLQVIGPI